MKEENFPHTRKLLHWWKQGVGGREASEPWRRAQPQGCRGQSGEIPTQGSSADQHSAARRLVCSPTRAGRGWELRLGLRRSDPRERTGVGCVNTA